MIFLNWEFIQVCPFRGYCADERCRLQQCTRQQCSSVCKTCCKEDTDAMNAFMVEVEIAEYEVKCGARAQANFKLNVYFCSREARV